MAMLVYVAGDRSGVGKSTVCLGILGCLLKLGYKPHELGYIKPCTQCEDVQLVSKFCEKVGIHHLPVSPIRFYQGFTYECIDEPADDSSGVQARRTLIHQAVAKIAQGKRLVLIDGVGYAAVGSVAGISNAQVASLLQAPVVVIGRSGVGDAIDSLNLALAYFGQHHVQVIGAIFNNIPKKTTYHDFEHCQTYVSKYLKQFQPTVEPFGFIPRHDALFQHAEENKSSEICILRVPRGDPLLQLSEHEEKLIEAIIEHTEQHVRVQDVVHAVEKFHRTIACMK